MKRIWVGMALFFMALSAFGQTGALQGHSFLGGTSAVTSGLNSTNYLNGIIPSATITVYLAGTTNLATIYSDRNNTPLSNPFTSNALGSVNPGGWIFFANDQIAYDVVASRGVSPNTYPQPVTLCKDCFPSTQLTLQMNLQHNSSATNIDQNLYNLCDNGSCGPALDAGMQQVTAKTGAGDGSWVLETASTTTQIQQAPTGLPAGGQYAIAYPQSGSTSCSGGGVCSYGTGIGAWMQMSNTGTIFGAGSNVTETGTALPTGVSDANVTAVYLCSTGYTMGYGAKSIPGSILTSGAISYGTYCVKVASGPGYNYAGASWQSTMSCSSGCSGQSMYSFAQPFMVVYYSGTPVTTDYLSFASPLIVAGQTVGLATAWPAVFDTGTANAYISTAPWVTNLIAGQEVILTAANANTGASTFAFNGASAASIVKAGGAALVAGDITTNAPALLIYQADGTWLDLDPQTGGTSSLALTTTGTTGAATYSGGTLNIPVYQGQLTLTTTGTSGAATLTGNALNIPNYSTGSGLPSCTSGQMVYYAANGTTGSCLTVGTNLSITSGTLNASGSGGANLTMNNSGSGAASGTTYNGSAAETISYNTIGAAPALGNCTVETTSFSAAAASCYYGNAASSITATLPSISTGAIIRIQNINSGTVTASFGSNFNCTLNGTTTSTTTCEIANGSTGLVTTDGTNWYVFVAPSAAPGGVSSVSNSDGSLTVSPTTGAVVGSINYAHAGTWTALETFNAGISTSALTLSGITGSTQCLHVNSSGVVSGTGSDCGSGGGAFASPGINYGTSASSARLAVGDSEYQSVISTPFGMQQGSLQVIANSAISQNVQRFTSDYTPYWSAGPAYASKGIFAEDYTYSLLQNPSAFYGSTYGSSAIRNIIGKFIAAADTNGQLPVAIYPNDSTLFQYSGFDSNHAYWSGVTGYMVPLMAWVDWKKTEQTTEYTAIVSAIKKNWGYSPVNGTTGCPSNTVGASEWVPQSLFLEQARMSGDIASACVLRDAAAIAMYQMATAAGDSTNATYFSDIVTLTTSSIQSEFVDSTSGMLFAATGQDKQIDVLTSSMAVWFSYILGTNILSTTQQQAIGTFLNTNFPTMVYNGYFANTVTSAGAVTSWTTQGVIPSGGGGSGYTAACGSTTTYQNGYWSLDTGMAMYAISLVSYANIPKILGMFRDASDPGIEYYTQSGGTNSGTCGTATTPNMESPQGAAWAAANIQQPTPVAAGPAYTDLYGAITNYLLPLENWKANEGTGTTLNNTGWDTGNPVTAANITWGTTTGFPGSSAQYDGSTSYAIASNYTFTNFDGTKPFSACTWFRATALTADSRLMTTFNSGAASISGWDVYIPVASKEINVGLSSVLNSNEAEVHTTSSVSTATTYQMCFTYDGSKTGAGILIYLNGAEAATAVGQNTLTGSIVSAQPLTIGALYNGSTYGSFFDGTIGYTRVYTVQLTASQVEAIYNAGPQ